MRFRGFGKTRRLDPRRFSVAGQTHVNIRAVVANAVDASRVLASRHGSELIVHVPDEPVPVEMDSRRVERILRNLLGNALDHGESRPVGGTVVADEHAVAKRNILNASVSLRWYSCRTR